MKEEKHHFVPKTYLKLFTNKDSEFFSAKFLNEYYTVPKLSKPSKVCYEIDMYKYGFEASELYETEKKAFRYENKDLVEIFSEIGTYSFKRFISIKKYKKLIRILLHLKFRNRRVRSEMYENNFIGTINSSFINEMSNIKSKEDYLIMARVYDSILELYKNDKDLLSKWHNDSLLEMWYGRSKVMEDAINYLSKFPAVVLKPRNKNDFFLTGDNPGFIIKKNNQVFNFGIIDFQLLGFPLNPKSVFMIINQSFKSDSRLISKPIDVKEIGSEETYHINEATALNSKELLLCNEYSYLFNFINQFRTNRV